MRTGTGRFLSLLLLLVGIALAKTRPGAVMMSTAARARALSVLVLFISLSTGCAVARWHVPVTPLAGQSEAQVDRDRSECDNEAKTSSGYSRMAELKGWLIGSLYVPAFAVAGAIMAPLPVRIADIVSLRSVGEGVVDAVTKPIPEIPQSAFWGGYFEQYRACMRAKGHTVRHE